MRLLPLSFTPEFRRMLAELPQASLVEWMSSLGRTIEASANRDEWTRDFESDIERELREVARACRTSLVADVQKKLGPFAPLHLRALLEVPRERFVRASDIARSAEDTPLPLDDDGLATISAPHAYVLSFRLLELAPGDTLLELGSGSGYGAALSQFIVTDDGRAKGHVTTMEIDPRLAALTERNVAGLDIDVRCGDATGEPPRVAAAKIVVTFAIDAIPAAWIERLPEGGRLVAPVGPRERDQRLVCIRRVQGELRTSDHGAVRYVQNRSKR